MTARGGTLAAGALATALLVGLAAALPLHRVLLLGVGVVALCVSFIALRRHPELASVLVVGGLALQPALKFFVSSDFGPAKDAVVLLIGAAFVSRVLARHQFLPGRDGVITVFAVALVVLYVVNPAGAHGGAWSDETRLVLESFLLFGVAFAEPDPAPTARVAITTLIVVACAEAAFGIFQQAVGYAYLVVHLGYTYGDQVRLSSSGHLRSFGTFEDAFSYASFELLALVCSMRWRSRGGVVFRWLVPGVLSVGVVVSFVRTDWVILAVLGLVALCRGARRSAWVGLIGASSLAALALVAVLSTTTIAGSGTPRSASFLLSLNGRTLVWDKLVPTPGVLLAGDGVGVFGSGLARAAQGSGVAALAHYVPGHVATAVSVGAVTSVDSAYLAVLADVGVPGLLLLLGILYRLLRIFRRAVRRRAPAGWTGLGILFVMTVDGLTRSSLTAFPSGYIYLFLVGVVGASALSPGQGQEVGGSGVPPVIPRLAGTVRRGVEPRLEMIDELVSVSRPTSLRPTAFRPTAFRPSSFRPDAPPAAGSKPADSGPADSGPADSSPAAFRPASPRPGAFRPPSPRPASPRPASPRPASPRPASPRPAPRPASARPLASGPMARLAVAIDDVASVPGVRPGSGRLGDGARSAPDGSQPPRSPEPSPPGFRARRGASSAVVSRVVGKVIGLTLIVVLAHHSTTARFAQYSYLLITAVTLTTLTDLGVAAVAGREVARGDMGLASAYRAALPSQLGSNLVAAVVVVVFGSLAPGPGVTLGALAATAVFSFANGIFDLQCELLRGSGRPMTEAGLQVVGAVLQTGLCTAAILSGGNLVEIMAMMALASILSMIGAQCFLPRPRHQGQDRLQRTLLSSALWLGAGTTCLAVTLRISALLLANLGSTTQIADFVVASRYLDLATTVCYTLGIGLLPSLARRAAQSPADFRRHARGLVGLATGALAVLAVLAALVAPRVTTLLFGQKYHGASSTAQLFVICAPVLLVLYLCWFVLLAERRERWVTLGTLVGLVATLAGCAAVLLPHRTALAAGLSTMVGLGVSAAVLVVVALLAPARRRPALIPEPDAAMS